MATTQSTCAPLACPGDGGNRLRAFIPSASSLLHPNDSFFAGRSTLPTWRSLNLKNQRPRARTGGPDDADEGDTIVPPTIMPVSPDLMMPTLGMEDGAVGPWFPERSSRGRRTRASDSAGDVTGTGDFVATQPLFAAQHEEVTVRRNHFDPDECEELSRPSSTGASSPLIPIARRKRRLSSGQGSAQCGGESALPLTLRPIGRKRTMPRRRDSLERLLDRSSDLLLDSCQLGSSAEAA